MLLPSNVYLLHSWDGVYLYSLEGSAFAECLHHFVQHGLHFRPTFLAQSVNINHAVQVIVLVLEDACLPPLESPLYLFPL